MPWILVDLALALLSLALLAVLVLRLWRKVKALSSAVAKAGEAVATATDALTVAQNAGPLGGPRPDGAALPGGHVADTRRTGSEA